MSAFSANFLRTATPFLEAWAEPGPEPSFSFGKKWTDKVGDYLIEYSDMLLYTTFTYYYKLNHIDNQISLVTLNHFILPWAQLSIIAFP